MYTNILRIHYFETLISLFMSAVWGCLLRDAAVRLQVSISTYLHIYKPIYICIYIYIYIYIYICI